MARADVLRIATWHAPLSRDGPGLLLRDIEKGDDPVLRSVLAELGALKADVLVLTDIDYDHGGAALAALAVRLRDLGLDYPNMFAARPNAGLPTDRDIDGNGRLGEARDAHGWGRYSGEGGMAVLSNRPIGNVVDLGALVWRDLPDSLIAADDPAHDIQRLSSDGHWIVPVAVAPDMTVSVMVFHATPPVFDGPEDRNGRRNADEIRLWQLVLDGAVAPGAPSGPFVIAGNANLDPDRGEGRHDAIRALLADPRLQDPAPGVPSVDWSRLDLGEMRVSYVLPSADIDVRGAGTGGAATTGEHRPVWVDIAVPPRAPDTAAAH